MRDATAWVLATLIVTALVAVVIGGGILLVHWGHTRVGLIWVIGGALIMRSLGRVA